MHPWTRPLIIVTTLALATPFGVARAAQKAHGRTHTRYAVELAERIATTRTGDGPLTLDRATPADADHRRALQLRFHNNSGKEIVGFSWRWVWDSGRCPALTSIVGAPDSYTAGPVAAGAVVDVYVAPEVVRDLLRTTRKRCHRGPSVELEVTVVRFADGSGWEASSPATPSN